MSNKLTNAVAFAGVPVRLSGTALLIHALLLHRFDEREFVDGRPNRGYRKSYPGNEEIMRWTGKSRQANNDAIEELILNGIVIRVEIGRPGNQANFVPIYALGLLGDYVNHALHKSKNYKGKKLAVSDKPASPMSKESLPNVSTDLYTISNISNTSNNRNRDRFTVFIDSLPIALKCLEPGTNLDALLDVLEAKGGTLNALAGHLNEHDYTGSNNLNAVLFNRLRTYIEALPDRKLTADRNRELQSELAEMQRNKATPEQRTEHIAQARKNLDRK